MSNPNSQLWNNYEAFGRERGRLVVHTLSVYMELTRSRILDYGAGTGSIALECARAGAEVDAFEPHTEKAKILQQQTRSQHLNVRLLTSFPKYAQYDAIVVLDVIEHLNDPETYLSKFHNLLQPGGIIYLSTPNKFSPAHVILDPHFSLPILSLASRKTVKLVVADILKWQSPQRQDFPELFSLAELVQLFEKTGFSYHFVNRVVLDYAWEHPGSVWNRELHLNIVKGLQKLGVHPFKAVVTDKVDVFNSYLNPTWYMILQKKPDSKRVGLK